MLTPSEGELSVHATSAAHATTSRLEHRVVSRKSIPLSSVVNSRDSFGNYLVRLKRHHRSPELFDTNHENFPNPSKASMRMGLGRWEEGLADRLWKSADGGDGG
jgi:hypothetical protein